MSLRNDPFTGQTPWHQGEALFSNGKMMLGGAVVACIVVLAACAQKRLPATDAETQTAHTPNPKVVAEQPSPFNRDGAPPHDEVHALQPPVPKPSALQAGLPTGGESASGAGGELPSVRPRGAGTAMTESSHLNGIGTPAGAVLAPVSHQGTSPANSSSAAPVKRPLPEAGTEPVADGTPAPEAVPLPAPIAGSSDAEQVAPTGTDESGQGAANQLLYLAIAILSLVALISTGTSLYLYLRRNQPLAGRGLSVPANWTKHLAELGNAIAQLGADQKKNLQTVSAATSQNTEKTANMVSVYMELHKALDQKDAEIKRLKGGYDAAIFKQFIARFARIDKAVGEYLEEGRDKDALTALQELLEDAFDECGVTKFYPEVGADYRKAEGVADHPRVERTEDASNDFKIAEVIEPGYKLVAGEDSSVLVPAKVRIYKSGG